MDRCEVLHPSIGEHLVALGNAIEKLSIKSQVPQLEVAVAENNTVLITTSSNPAHDRGVSDTTLCDRIFQ
jgi:23S rRNA (uracil1939-C5)-methyltransferase